MKSGFLTVCINTIILIGIFTAPLSSGSNPVLTASVDHGKATVGYPLLYVLKISGNDLDGFDIVLPKEKKYFPDAASKKKSYGKGTPSDSIPLFIIESAERKKTEIQGKEVCTIAVRIAYYRPGNHTLPEIEIYDNDGIRIGYNVPAVLIEESNPQGLYQDIEPPIMPGRSYTRLLVLLGLAVLLGAVAYGAFVYYGKKKKMSRENISTESPYDAFVRDVTSLKNRDLIRDGRSREFIRELSLLFRKYLSIHLKIQALEMTGQQIELYLGKIIPTGKYNTSDIDISQILNLWDLSKFAEFSPTVKDLEANLKNTEELARKISRYGADVRY